jgi:hypothetical protein
MALRRQIMINLALSHASRPATRARPSNALHLEALLSLHLEHLAFAHLGPSVMLLAQALPMNG